MARDKEHKRLSIAELEELLNKENSWDDDRAIQILPNGEITYADARVKDVPKVLTMKESLGGEYCLRVR